MRKLKFARDSLIIDYVAITYTTQCISNSKSQKENYVKQQLYVKQMNLCAYNNGFVVEILQECMHTNNARN